jgi:glucose/arabinose dehydrogenase
MSPTSRIAGALIALATLCLSPSALAAIRLVPVASGLSSPLFVGNAGDNSDRLFIVERAGVIRVLQPGGATPTTFLDIRARIVSGGERGLLGLAFHPQYASNGRFFVFYTRTGDGALVIAEYRVSSDPNVADLAETVLLTIPHPSNTNHNGGMLAFGSDGFLYVGVGDGGAGNDPPNNAQNINVLLGKILRIDVDAGQPYAVPADNPFGNEIWAYGLRNPWRMSFDSVTGDLYIGDVGQGEWEEIDFIPAGSAGGQNYGWDYREGAHDYEGGGPAGMIDPIAEYSHAEGRCSVTGGYVYRGAMSEWHGIYLYGDYCTGFIWGLINVNGQWQKQLLFDTDVNITSFGRDEQGEIYLIGDGGGVYRLERK